MQLCFATNNAHKLDEVRQILGKQFQVLSLADIGCDEELPENQATLAGNSEEKAVYVYQHYHINCFADDTGLEVDALDGEPGVYSARYAGPQRSGEDNMYLLLQKLAPEAERSAQFRTVITLILDGKKHQFEGAVRGSIAHQRSGNGGFGYDPIFIPEGYDKSFAEMSPEDKNKISHRGKAISKLVHFLQNQVK